MRKNHVPFSCAFTSLVVFLLVVPKKHNNFTPREVLYALGLGLLMYVYAVIFDLGESDR